MAAGKLKPMRLRADGCFSIMRGVDVHRRGRGELGRGHGPVPLKETDTPIQREAWAEYDC
jgi:hypothetical protein